jgi:hypothetical protein
MGVCVERAPILIIATNQKYFNTIQHHLARAGVYFSFSMDNDDEA